MYRQLERLARKWKKLTYPRFVIQAESEINPDRTNDPDDNFSIPESVRGWIAPIPLRYRSDDLRTYVDHLGRPDRYAIGYCNGYRRSWNEDIRHHEAQIYVVKYRILETHPATKRKPEYSVPVTHSYLQTLRGKDSVRQIDRHFVDMMGGLEEARERVQPCIDEDAVDRAIEQVLAENERIQNGGR